MNKNTEQFYKWRKENPERAKELQRRYKAKTREKRRAYMASHRRKNLAAFLVKEREGRDRNRNKINTRMTVRRVSLRQQCLNACGGNRCILCGFTSDITSQFDLHHKNPALKSFTIAAAISKGWTFEMIKPELSKCVVLCKNCHGAITSTQLAARKLRDRLDTIIA